MDRSRRQGARVAPRGPASLPEKAPPRASRLTIRPKNQRRRPTASLWERLPAPAVVANACGRALRRALPALAAVGVLGAIGGTAWAGYELVTHSQRFAIAQISIRGNHHLADDQIRALLPIRVGDNVFAADLDAAIRELRANPWVESAESHRVLPRTIAIEVHEHEPVALADLGGFYLVDASGHPFKRAALDTDDVDGLPIVTGLDRIAYLADPAATAHLVQSALGALSLWRAGGRPAIGEIHIDPHGALTLHTFDRATAVQLGGVDDGLAARMRTFDAAWAELSDDERARTRAVHLDTHSDHVTVAFNSASAQKDP